MDCKKLSIDEQEVEVSEILVALVKMSDEYFKECIEYAKNTEMHPRTRKFLEKCIEIASKKREVVAHE